MFNQAVQKFKRLSRTARYATYSVSAYLVYCLLLGALAPYLIKQQLPKQLTELIGKQVTLQEVSINPVTLALTLEHFEVLDETQSLISFEYFSVQFNLWESIFNGAFVLQDIHLAKLMLKIERLNDPLLRFNFTDMLERVQQRLSVPPGQSSNDEKSTLPAVLINQVQLSGMDISFEDLFHNAQLRYPNIDIELKQLDTQMLFSNANKAVFNHYKMRVQDSDHAILDLQGQFQLQPLEIKGKVALVKLQLPRLWAFIDAQMQVHLKQGEVSLSSHFLVQQNSQKQWQVITEEGQFSSENIQLTQVSGALLDLPLFELQGITSNLQSQTLNLGRLHSQGLQLFSKIDKNGLDLIALLNPKISSDPDKLSQKEKETTSVSEHKPWLVQVQQVQLKDYQVQLQESSVTKNSVRWTLANINLTTSALSSDLKQRVVFNISSQVNDATKLAVEGVVDPVLQAIDADVSIESLPLKQLQPYIATALNVTLTKGVLTSQSKLHASITDGLKAQGSVAIKNLSIRDNRIKKALLKWQYLGVNQFDFNSKKNHLEIDTVTLSQPYAKVVISKDRSTNLSHLLVATTEKKSEKTIKQPPFALNIKKINIKQGSTFFADNSLTPNFVSSIEKLQGEIDGLSSVPGSKAIVNIKGNIDKYAPVSIKGEINPLLKHPYIDLDLHFKGIELATVNPYSGTYAGYYIDKGQLSLVLNYKLENNKLQGSNHVVIDQLKLGKASNSELATSLPLSLAIALLQDNDGVIDLGVDVSGDMNNPDFSIGSVIFKMLGNIISKAVTSPFSFLTGLAGDEDELNKIPFTGGSYLLTLEQQKTLQILGDALQRRPQLKLSVDGSVDVSSDSKVLAEALLLQRIIVTAKLSEEEVPAHLSAENIIDYKDLSAALISLYEKQFKVEAALIKQQMKDKQLASGDILSAADLQQRWLLALYSQLLSMQSVSNSQLGQLAQLRAKTVKAYLVEDLQIASDRVFLMNSRFKEDMKFSGVVLTLESQ